MKKVYFGADWHFSKYKKKLKTMKYDPERSKEIISKYKEIIDNDDLFVFLGDLSYIGKKNTEDINKLLDEIKHLPGRKIFIRGNNDEESDEYYKKLGFDIVETSLKVDNILFTHDPEQVEGNTINIHGHIHGSEEYWNCEADNHVDCFTKLFDLYPVELESLLTNGKFIKNKDSLTDEFFETLKKHLFELV